MQGKLSFEWWCGWIFWVRIPKCSLLPRKASELVALRPRASCLCARRGMRLCVGPYMPHCFFCIPLEIAPGTFSWEENQKTPVTAGSWCLNSKRTDGRMDEGSCIPAYGTHRLVKSCSEINKVCLEEKWVMFCGVTKWIRHAVDVLSRNFQGSGWPHPQGLFFFLPLN